MFRAWPIIGLSPQTDSENRNRHPFEMSHINTHRYRHLFVIILTNIGFKIGMLGKKDLAQKRMLILTTLTAMNILRNFILKRCEQYLNSNLHRHCSVTNLFYLFLLIYLYLFSMHQFLYEFAICEPLTWFPFGKYLNINYS